MTGSGRAPVAAALRDQARMLHALRTTFAGRGYLEVPTPCLVPSPALEPFLHPLRADGGYLRTSPEFALKRALAAGVGRIYEIGPCFRAREIGPWHRTEFLMCEWYRPGASLDDLMDEVETLVGAAATALERPAPRFVRRTVAEVFAATTGLDLRVASAADLSDVPESWDDAFARRWVTDVEPALTEPVFLRDWPASQAALARVIPLPEGATAMRFEAYLNGVELANAFLELIDGPELRRRFDDANVLRASMGEPAHPVDDDLIEAVGRMPPTAGIAMGVDRLLAALTASDGLRPTVP
ncbi:MAG: amino acid--tRNA ligase-related protein [Myxococcota bacterium]